MRAAQSNLFITFKGGPLPSSLRREPPGVLRAQQPAHPSARICPQQWPQPSFPTGSLPCCLTEGWDWKWHPARGLMACHIPSPREVPNAWSWGCLPQVLCSWLGDGIGGAARSCLLTPMGTLLALRESPAPLTLSEQFSPMLCYFLPPCVFTISSDKSILDVFSKLNNWRGLPADNETVSKLSGACWFVYLIMMCDVQITLAHPNPISEWH